MAMEVMMIINKQLMTAYQPLLPEQRLHKIPTPIVAITGGIASGKSTVVKQLQQLGQQVLSADHLIKEIYLLDEIILFIRNNKPSVFEKEKINFASLRNETFNDATFKLQLETLLYSKLPEVFWLNYKKLTPATFFFYEVPLLFEKKLQHLVDIIVLLQTNEELQLERMSKRDPSTLDTNKKILQAQLPFEMKKHAAHFILNNNGNEEELTTQVLTLHKELHNLFKKNIT